MRTRRDSTNDYDLRADGGVANNPDPGEICPENYREFVMTSIAAFAESGLAMFQRPTDQDQYLYLFTGEAFQLGEAGITRLR